MTSLDGRRPARLRARGRPGFTLVEILVAIVILAVIATFVVPLIIQQSGRAGPVRAAHDLASIRTGMDIFHLQTRTAYPRRLTDLITPIQVTDLGLDSIAYTPAEVSRWSGPYLDPLLATPSSNLRTGSGVDIRNSFAYFDVDTNCGVTATNRASAEFVAIRTLTITWETFQAINEIVDGDEPAGYGPGLSSHTGKFRMNDCPQPINTTNPSGSAYYLALPH